ncbi:MAG: Lon protease family protein, partial [candidate division WOR-3 bacterium]
QEVIGNLERFIEKEEPPAPFPIPKVEDKFVDFQVNVLVDNSETKGPPIITETSPNYRNLFGTIERVVDRMGGIRTDFTKIKAGSLLRANNGFLILNALDVLMEPGLWQALKRTLRNGVIDIQTYDPFYIFGTTALKPEPIPCTAKVVMIGNAYLYSILYHYDEDFKKIFKVKADFDNVMPNTPKTRNQYGDFICFICKEECLLHFDRTAVAEVIEYGARIAGRKNKLTTRFHIIADILREASYWAKKDNARFVSSKYVEKAIEEWVERVSLVEDKISEMIKEGTIMIDTRGREIGQVNGLSVYTTGEYSFGKPTRITAKTSMGRAGIINIEREADLSGPIHNKGVLILSGYLRWKYGQNKPLVMTASLCFEQSYGEVEGDSASSTEVYAILSSLANVPLRQDIAVTGSVNQKGEIQPIGGVNQKIEGFFDVCKAAGLTGKQGVMIPYLNIPDLMLKKDVVDAVRQGKFHIYPVKTIDEGIEILTGMKAGKRLKNGQFEKDSINYLVDKRLRELAENWQKFSGEEEKEPESKKLTKVRRDPNKRSVSR